MIRAVVALLIAVSLSGCVTETSPFYEFDATEHYRNPGVFDGHYRSGDSGSFVLEPGNMTHLGPEVVRLQSNLPAYDGLVDMPELRGDVDITMAIWRPVEATEPVPVIVDAGPYFEVGGLTIDEPTQRTPMMLENYLPRGYAVVQLAVRGTGTSGGCMDLLGPSEQHDLNQAITWLGEQNWTNGRIGMIGGSYDGTTPWLVAAAGNPYLKTIVPGAGLPSIHDLMFRNGSAETRGAVMHNQVYWGYGFDRDFVQPPENWPEGTPWLPPLGLGEATDREPHQDYQNLLCPEVVEGSALAAYSTSGGGTGSAASTYWTERDYRQRVLDHYEGSVFVVHGLQDWNVDPHTVIPYTQELRDAGLDVKEWYGQWGHTFPDGTCANTAPDWVVLPCRMDFGEVLGRWFDRYLKGMDVELGPEIQVQDNVGFWRNADSYPPANPNWLALRLSGDGSLVETGGTDGELLIAPDATGPGTRAEFITGPLEDDLHLSGLMRLNLPFTVSGQGGSIGAWLFDVDPRGYARAFMAIPFGGDSDSTEWMPYGAPLVGHAQMNLRHHAGGNEPDVLVPGQRTIARMEFEPLEARIPAGNQLMLWLFQYQYEEHQDTLTPAPVTLHFDDEAVLRLSTLDVDPRTVFPVPGAHLLNRTYVPEMYVPVPVMEQGPGTPSPPTGPISERRA